MQGERVHVQGKSDATIHVNDYHEWRMIIPVIYTQLLQLQTESLKKFRLVQDSNPWPLRYRCRQPAPSWLVSLIECCTGIAEVKGLNHVQAWIFFRLSFRNCKSRIYNCDHPSFNSSLCSSHIRFSYFHNFIIMKLSTISNQASKKLIPDSGRKGIIT